MHFLFWGVSEKYSSILNFQTENLQKLKAESNLYKTGILFTMTIQMQNDKINFVWP